MSLSVFETVASRAASLTGGAFKPSPRWKPHFSPTSTVSNLKALMTARQRASGFSASLHGVIDAAAWQLKHRILREEV
jgi:hypothetical protein